MPDVPAGTVTFLFTDIESSTNLLENGPVTVDGPAHGGPAVTGAAATRIVATVTGCS